MTNKYLTKNLFNSRNRTMNRNIKHQSLCNTAFNIVQKHATLPFKQYQTYLETQINTFITNNKHLLDTLFHTKQTLLKNTIHKDKNIYSYTVYNYPTPLDKSIRIPPYKEILKYLLAQPNFKKLFSFDDITNLNNIYSSNNTDSIFNYLETHPIGKILSYNFYRYIFEFQLEKYFPSIKFHNLLINSFTSYKILQTLETTITNCLTVSITWNGHTYKNIIYIFYNNKTDNPNNKSFLDKIISRILFLNIISKTHKLPNKIILILTNLEKEIDDNILEKAHFKTLNINTAVTNNHDIIIYRKQELLKSIFHELIHFYNLDFKTIPINVSNSFTKFLKDNHYIDENNEYIFFESVTEVLTNLLNNIFHSKNINEFKQNYLLETTFSTFQTFKILKICGFNSWNEFTKKNKYKNQPKKFKQDSCVFSYYILKLYILLNLDYYFQHILDKQLKFINSSTSFEHLIELFKHSFNNVYLENLINFLLKTNIAIPISNNNTHNKTKKNTTHNLYATHKIYRTLRMTCLE
jgi:hypothetical protein